MMKDFAVVRGNPTGEELAAVVAILAARAAEPAPEPEPAAPRPRSYWADRRRLATRRPQPGAGAWRASAW